MIIKKVDIFSVFLRSFFIQAAWNFQSMISIGLCYTLLPIGRRLFDDQESYKNFILRHLSFFNAHPYFASFALGAIINLENKETKQISRDYQQLDKFKNAVTGPLGAVGDQVFWATIKPASLLVCVAGFLLIYDQYMRLVFIPLFLILYNVPHFYIRYRGIIRGYKKGINIYRTLRPENFTVYFKIFRAIGGLALGTILGIILLNKTMQGAIEIPIFILSGLIAFILRTQRRMTYLPIFIPIILSIIFGMII